MVEFPGQRAANFAALSSVLSMAGSDEDATRMIAMAFEIAKSVEEGGITSAITGSEARQQQPTSAECLGRTPPTPTPLLTEY